MRCTYSIPPVPSLLVSLDSQSNEGGECFYLVSDQQESGSDFRDFVLRATSRKLYRTYGFCTKTPSAARLVDR
jgi:hypothetical protein